MSGPALSCGPRRLLAFWLICAKPLVDVPAYLLLHIGIRALVNGAPAANASAARRGVLFAGEPLRDDFDLTVRLVCAARPAPAALLASLSRWEDLRVGRATGLGSVLDLLMQLRKIADVPPEVPPRDTEFYQLAVLYARIRAGQRGAPRGDAWWAQQRARAPAQAREVEKHVADLWYSLCTRRDRPRGAAAADGGGAGKPRGGAGRLGATYASGVRWALAERRRDERVTTARREVLLAAHAAKAQPGGL